MTYTIQFEEKDLFQILEGLEIRAEAWEKTAEYHRTGYSPDDTFIVEECSSAAEADNIAENYRSIVANIRKQIEKRSTDDEK